MKLLLTRLYNMQEKLDAEIIKNHSVEHVEELYHKKVVALQVELCELANEMRFFKYWSNKGPSDRVLDEYVDALHFFLSIGILIEAQDFVPSYPNDDSIDFDKVDNTVMFAEIMKLTSNMYFDVRHFGFAFMAFLDFGYKNGLKWDSIITAYEKKNKENHQRQASGY